MKANVLIFILVWLHCSRFLVLFEKHHFSITLAGLTFLLDLSGALVIIRLFF